MPTPTAPSSSLRWLPRLTEPEAGVPGVLLRLDIVPITDIDTSRVQRHLTVAIEDVHPMS
jgi:hypothetical protein